MGFYIYQRVGAVERLPNHERNLKSLKSMFLTRNVNHRRIEPLLKFPL